MLPSTAPTDPAPQGQATSTAAATCEATSDQPVVKTEAPSAVPPPAPTTDAATVAGESPASSPSPASTTTPAMVEEVPLAKMKNDLPAEHAGSCHKESHQDEGRPVLPEPAAAQQVGQDQHAANAPASSVEPKKISVAPGVWIKEQAIPTKANPESKNSIKKRQKAEEYASKKKELKRQRKEKAKQNKQERKLQGQEQRPRGNENDGDEENENQSVFDPNIRLPGQKPPDQPLRPGKKEKREFLKQKAEKNCRILIDCDWEKLMTDKEVKSLASQLMYSFSRNKIAEEPCNFLLSKCSGLVKENLNCIVGSENWPCFTRFEECLLAKNFGATNLPSSEEPAATSTTAVVSSTAATVPVETSPAASGNYKEGDATNEMKEDVVMADAEGEGQHREETSAVQPLPPAFSSSSTNTTSSSKQCPFLTREKTVYLTADTDDVLTEIDPDTTYIIGGVVDRNRLKNASKQKADHFNIRTQRLPIAEYIESNMGSFSKVLTVNHVVEILLEFQRTKDWTVSLEAVLPKRRKDQGEREEEARKAAKEREAEVAEKENEGEKLEKQGGEDVANAPPSEQPLKAAVQTGDIDTKVDGATSSAIAEAK
ncbi:unnamed protein product [Amoebophrya sp. A120]|nr:unnamed protein product [Amoebophrya sp. A120]|eukprot:GSA120T00024658001.1